MFIASFPAILSSVENFDPKFLGQLGRDMIRVVHHPADSRGFHLVYAGEAGNAVQFALPPEPPDGLHVVAKLEFVVHVFDYRERGEESQEKTLEFS